MATISGRTAFNLLEREECKITIGGKTYTMAQYKKMLADKKKEQAKAERAKAKAEGKKIVKVKKAKDTILYGVIGLVVCVLAFAIVNFIINNIIGGQ